MVLFYNAVRGSTFPVFECNLSMWPFIWKKTADLCFGLVCFYFFPRRNFSQMCTLALLEGKGIILQCSQFSFRLTILVFIRHCSHQERERKRGALSCFTQRYHQAKNKWRDLWTGCWYANILFSILTTCNLQSCLFSYIKLHKVKHTDQGDDYVWNSPNQTKTLCTVPNYFFVRRICMCIPIGKR